MQVRGQARRHCEIQLAEELIAIFAVELQGEGAEGAGGRVRGTRFQGRIERPDLARAFGAVRTGFEAEDLARLWSGSASSQGKKSALTVIDRAGGRRRHQRPF